MIARRNCTGQKMGQLLWLNGQHLYLDQTVLVILSYIQKNYDDSCKNFRWQWPYFYICNGYFFWEIILLLWILTYKCAVKKFSNVVFVHQFIPYEQILSSRHTEFAYKDLYPAPDRKVSANAWCDKNINIMAIWNLCWLYGKNMWKKTMTVWFFVQHSAYIF